jgi:hypothetical protein
VSKTIGFFIQGGINLAVPIIKNYSSSGTYTYSGFYPAYNVLLTDIPYEGFKSNVESNVNGELKIKSINPELITSVGFSFYPERQYQISLSVFYKKMLSDISDYNHVSSFQLSTQQNQSRNFMEGSNKVSMSSMGFAVSLRYYFR